jgi:hypothetical protein
LSSLGLPDRRERHAGVGRLEHRQGQLAGMAASGLSLYDDGAFLAQPAPK